MDHIYLDFWSYIWVVCFVEVNAIVLWATGLAKLRIREILHSWGWITPAPIDYPKVCADAILNTHLALHYQKMRKSGGEIIGVFLIRDFPHVTDDMEFHQDDLLMEVDLKQKVLIEAKLGKTVLDPTDAIMYLGIRLFFAGHVQLHAMGNWGTNPQVSNWFVKRMSTITVMYNYFGRTVFSRLIRMLGDYGIFKHINQDGFKGLLGHEFLVIEGLNQGIPKHHNVR